MTLKRVKSESWKSSAFPILVCMPFKRPEVVLESWSHFIRPTLMSLGEVVRIDWTTDDWVRDLREVAGEVAFVLVDLTEAKPSVIRELNFMFQERVSVICYMNRPKGIEKQITTVGMIDPQTATKSWGGGLDLEILSHHVYIADYTKSKELYKLCDYLKEKLKPFQDRDDPSLAYIDSDISQLSQDEQEGFLLARIPRSRIISMSEYWHSLGTSNYWERAEKLFSTSAIYRSRVISWLGNPNIILHTPENLWIREHLLWVVLHDVRSGNGLTESEYLTINRLEQAEPIEDIRFLISDIRSYNRTANGLALAVRQGIPTIPPRTNFKSPHTSSRVLIKLEFSPVEQFSGLQASKWTSSFPSSEGAMISQIAGAAQSSLRPRLFNIQATDTLPSYLTGRLGEIEDSLDQIAPRLATLVTKMTKSSWDPNDIEVIMKSILSLKLIQEIERRNTRTKWGEQYHIDLKRYLGQVWNRDAKDFYLFEFSSSYYKSHFRGLLPWKDIKESAIQLLAKIVAPIAKLPEPTIFQQTMEWDLPPAQLWDIILLERMNEALSPNLTKEIWMKYVLPSAFLYWHLDDIFADPSKADRWAYVVTQDTID